MAIDDEFRAILGEEPRVPGKEWRVTMPESDQLQAIMAEQAIRSVVRALGGDIKEVEHPTETVLTSGDILQASQEIFGTETYGHFANDYLDWINKGCKGEIVKVGDEQYFFFSNSGRHMEYPTFEQRVGVPRHATHKEIKQAVNPVLDTMGLPFTHNYHFYDPYRKPCDVRGRGRGYYVAAVVPEALTVERLKRFLLTPPRGESITPAKHTLHGVLGRALDVLCVVAGVKDGVDPSLTEAGDVVPLEELHARAIAEDITPGLWKGFNDRVQQGVWHQLNSYHAVSWFKGTEVVVEGDTRIPYTYSSFPDSRIDTISLETLRHAEDMYTRIDPRLRSFLQQYKD